MNCAENPFNMGMFLQLEMSFKMDAFSDTQHTHPGIFILESPPGPATLLAKGYASLFQKNAEKGSIF